jgi:elongation factor P
MLINGTQIRNGMFLVFKDDLCQVTAVDHITPGKGVACVQVKMKNVQTQANVEYRFRSNEKVEKAIIDTREAQYIYDKGSDLVFLDQESYEEIILSEEMLGETRKFLLHDAMVKIEFFKGQPIGVEPPRAVELKVTDTEPPFKGATAAGGSKRAELETGLVVSVPQFIETGDVVVVDSVECNYLERKK